MRGGSAVKATTVTSPPSTGPPASSRSEAHPTSATTRTRSADLDRQWTVFMRTSPRLRDADPNRPSSRTKRTARRRVPVQHLPCTARSERRPPPDLSQKRETPRRFRGVLVVMPRVARRGSEGVLHPRRDRDAEHVGPEEVLTGEVEPHREVIEVGRILDPEAAADQRHRPLRIREGLRLDERDAAEAADGDEEARQHLVAVPDGS